MNGVSIVIKCLNEEPKIDDAIRSALASAAELGPIPLEVVVADGLSTDETVAHAVRWAASGPVRVVQLVREEDRGCGAGVELGFSQSTGDRVLFMDGDMVLQPGFLSVAMRYLDEHPDCAGVAGTMTEATIGNGTDRIRWKQGLNRHIGDQPWLHGGGLYRRTALLDAGGYAGDHRLAAFEEADLGLRLERSGWRLHRLAEPAIQHCGHALPTWKVLRARWYGGRFEAAGRLLKLHGSQLNGWRVWRMLWHPLVLMSLWILLALAALTASPLERSAQATWLSVAVASTALLHLLLKRDFRHVLTAWLDWHLLMIGIVLGVLRPMGSRRNRIDHRVLADSTLGERLSPADDGRPMSTLIATT